MDQNLLIFSFLCITLSWNLIITKKKIVNPLSLIYFQALLYFYLTFWWNWSLVHRSYSPSSSSSWKIFNQHVEYLFSFLAPSDVTWLLSILVLFRHLFYHIQRINRILLNIRCSSERCLGCRWHLSTWGTQLQPLHVLVRLLNRCIFQFIVWNDGVNLVHSPSCVNK